MKCDFNNTLSVITGQSEGSVIEKLTETGEQLYDGGLKLAKCFLDLGIKIGDYLNVMLSGDSDMATQLIEQIQR